MVYDFSIKAKELNGEDVAGGRTLSNILLEFIGTETKGNTVKLCLWYSDLMVKKSLDLDEVDKTILVELISTSDRLMLFLKSQLIKVLNKTL